MKGLSTTTGLCAAVAALLAGVACGGGSGAGGDEGDEVLVRYVRSGGFAGTVVELVIDDSGAATLAVNEGNPIRFRIPKDDLSALAADVDEIDWAALKPTYRQSEVVADGFQYVLQHDGRRVEIVDPARPMPLRDLLADLDRIAAANTPPQVDSPND